MDFSKSLYRSCVRILSFINMNKSRESDVIDIITIHFMLYELTQIWIVWNLSQKNCNVKGIKWLRKFLIILIQEKICIRCIKNVSCKLSMKSLHWNTVFYWNSCNKYDISGDFIFKENSWLWKDNCFLHNNIAPLPIIHQMQNIMQILLQIKFWRWEKK